MIRLTEDKFQDFWTGLYNTKFHIEIVRRLHNRFKDQIFYIPDKDGFYLLHWAAIMGNNDLVDFILSRSVPIDQPMSDALQAQAIHLAAMEGRVNVLHTLVQNGVAIDGVDKRGCTALMRAANFGISHDFRSQDTVLFLLFSGANPRLLNNEGFSALHYAIQANNEQVVRLLVRVKIPVTLHTLSGPTCLHLAVKTGNANIIRDVITATPNAKDSDIHRFVRKYARPTAQQRMRNTFDTIAKSFIVCFLIGTVFWEYPQYIFVYFPATPELLPVHILLLILSSVTWCLWAKVVFGDPGFLPKFQPLYYEIVTKRLERQLRRKHAASFVRSSIDPYAYMRLCHLCECTQPMFVHHCSRCQRCVRMFDHHCLYLCNCIGLNNQIPFYFMLVGVMLCGFLNMLVVINMMCTHEAGFTLLHLANLIYSTKLILMSVIMLVWQLMKYYKRKNGQLRARKKAESESMSSPKERLNTSKV